MDIRVNFYSWFKDLTHCSETIARVPEGASIRDLKAEIFQQFPKLSSVEKSMLVAVGVDYQSGDYVLKSGDEVSLFPPVQGG